MFEGYPEPFLEIVRGTDPRAVAEHGIFTRQAEALPADGWGRGRVTLVGDAAHPVRPTGTYPFLSRPLYGVLRFRTYHPSPTSTPCHFSMCGLNYDAAHPVRAHRYTPLLSRSYIIL